MFEKRNDRWLIVHNHTSVAQGEPASTAQPQQPTPPASTQPPQPGKP